MLSPPPPPWSRPSALERILMPVGHWRRLPPAAELTGRTSLLTTCCCWIVEALPTADLNIGSSYSVQSFLCCLSAASSHSVQSFLCCLQLLARIAGRAFFAVFMLSSAVSSHSVQSFLCCLQLLTRITCRAFFAGFMLSTAVSSHSVQSFPCK